MQLEKDAVHQKVRDLKTLLKYSFVDLENTNPFTLNFHLLDHIGEEFSRFDAVQFPDAFSFECFSYVINKFTRMTFVRRVGTLAEAERPTNMSVESEENRNSIRAGIFKARLIRDGTAITLANIATSTLSILL